MKWLLPLLLFIPSITHSQGLAVNEKEFNYPSFRECGLVTRWASNSIPANCLVEATNVLFDEDLSAYRRRGQAQYNATPCTDAKAVRGLWKYNATDGQRYAVIFSSQTMFWTKNQGDCNEITGLSSLNADAEMECTQTLGKLWCTNGIDTPFWTTITSTGTFGWDGSAYILGTKISNFRNRVVMAGAPGQLSRILLSGEGDGEDWTLKIPGRSTSPSSIDISGMDDGKPVRALLGQYQNSFYIGREDDLSQLSGNDRRDFTLRQVSSQIGVLEGRSVREKDNCLLWISRRGVEKMCGTTIERASDPIRDLIDGIINAAGNTRTKTYDTQEQWDAGLYSTQIAQQGPTSTTIYPGSVVPSTWGHINTEGAQWAAGTAVDIDTSTLDGSIMLPYEQFSHNDTTTDPVWTKSVTVSGDLTAINGYMEGTVASKYGIYYTTSTLSYGTWEFDFYKKSSTFQSIIQFFQYGAETVPAGYSINIGVSIDGVYRNALVKYNTGPTVTLCTVSSQTLETWGHYTINRTESGVFTFIGPNGDYCTFTDTTFSTSNVTKVNLMYQDRIDNFKYIYLRNGDWESPEFDTTFSTPVAGPYRFIDDVPIGSTVIYKIAQSADSITWDGWVTVSTTTSGEFRPPFTKRYWKERIELSTQYSTQTPVVAMTSLEATATSYYIGDCVNTSGMTSWGNFRPDVTLTGASAISFAVSTGTSCHAVTRSTANWITQLANSPVSVSTSAYLGFRVFETPVTTTDTIRLDALTVEWNEGSERPPVASEVYKNRYMVFYTTNTSAGAVNDSTLVYDMNGIWSKLEGIYAYSALVYENQLYTGDSRDSGKIQIQDIGVDDINTSNVHIPYRFKIKTSDYDLGNPIEKKELKRVYLMLKSEEEPAQDINLTLKYYINGSTTAYSLSSVGLDEATEKGYFVAKFPAINSQPTTFNWISFSLEYDGLQGPVNLYGVKLVYYPIRWE